MSAAGTFDIPARPDQSTHGARTAYLKIWQRDWPHDDAFLRQLAAETPEHAADCAEGSRCQHLLWRMRENHVFT